MFGFNSYSSAICNSPKIKFSLKEESLKLSPKKVSVKMNENKVKLKIKVECNE